MQKDLVSPISCSCQYTAAKSQGPSFGMNTTAPKNTLTEIKHEDYILEPTATNKLKAKLHTAQNIPSYVKRGLSGDPDANFYEFMQISKIPYFLGGPGLVATILAGKNFFDIRANSAAKFNAKGMALGCAMYYVMVAIAKKCVDAPVKALRGVDLNHPYVDVVSTKAEDSDGKCSKKYEQHKVFESSKFIRWDLLYNRKSKDPKEINSKYNEYSKKMHMPEDANDSDSTVKPIIMSMIKQANAWKYIISAFAVMLGVGFGNQKALKDEFCTGITKSLKQDIDKNSKNKVKNTLSTLNIKILRPIKDSVVSLWKGTEGSLISKNVGKFAIIGFLASVAAANLSILKSTNKKGTDVVRTKEANA